MNTQQLKILIKRTVLPWYWRWQDSSSAMRDTVDTVNVLGDSHCRYFRYMQQHHSIPKTRVRVFSITGATAAGMINPASKTRAMPAVRSVLRRLPRVQSVLLSLGEVDVGFVIPMRCQRSGAPPEDELVKVFDAYMQFVSDVVAMGFAKVMLATVSPATIDDWSKWPGPVGHLRKQVTMSIHDRSQLASKFNALLRAGQSQYHYTFLDVESQFADDCGQVRPQLISDRAGDLHLNNKQAAAIYRDALQKEGFA